MTEQRRDTPYLEELPPSNYSRNPNVITPQRPVVIKLRCRRRRNGIRLTTTFSFMHVSRWSDIRMEERSIIERTVDGSRMDGMDGIGGRQNKTAPRLDLDRLSAPADDPPQDKRLPSQYCLCLSVFTVVFTLKSYCLDACCADITSSMTLVLTSIGCWLLFDDYG